MSFHEAIRPLFRRMSQPQADGINLICAEGARRGMAPRPLAYVLATTYHESAHTMQPIREYGGAAYFNRRYGPQTRVGKVLGNTQPGDGARYCGRGYVQITGRANYRRMGGLLGLPLEDQPDRALEPAVALPLLFEGMTRGLFTGLPLGNAANFREARRVVNGLDRANQIAGYAERFLAALSAEFPPPPIDLGTLY